MASLSPVMPPTAPFNHYASPSMFGVQFGNHSQLHHILWQNEARKGLYFLIPAYPGMPLPQGPASDAALV
ncbi:hypothetical protein Dda3937_02297 [Dickeya dadantii 3937]|uniref:Uncharacterized protein n=1 Tax=Dickeya dadantii (strain 3937) TaxID=198628 RepID=E0SLQ4_DICD3|nr:hypothetical protein Dda3937_02297 [Dickeya dadantii 3937]